MDSLRTLEAMNGAADEARAPGRVDATTFIGSWTSTSRDTQGIAGLRIREEGGQLFRARVRRACVPFTL